MHRLNDEMDEREFQRWTVAIPWQKFAKLKTMMREFIDKVELELTSDETPTDVFACNAAPFDLPAPQRKVPHDG